MKLRTPHAPCLRAWILPTLAFVAAGIGCQASDPNATAGGSETGPVLAQVGDRVIHEGDVDARLSAMPSLARPEFSSPIGKERLLTQIIEEEMLFQAALDEGLSADPQIARHLEASRRQILVQAYLDRRREEATRVSEEEALAFYDAHQDEYYTEELRRLRVLTNQSRSVVERAREMALVEKVPMVGICSRFNERQQLVEVQGLLPQWVRRGKSVPFLGNHEAFHEAAFSTPLGEISEIFEMAQGFCLLKVEEVQEARQRPFDEVRKDVEGRIARERGSRGLPELLGELRERYGVEIHAAPAKSAEELFAEAQDVTSPLRKVELFEELVQRYPEDPHVVEAWFMIGFTRAEEIGDPKGAEDAFRRVIEGFPDSELAQSARWMLTSGGEGNPDFEQDSSSN